MIVASNVVILLSSEIVAMERLEMRSSSAALPVIDSTFCMPHTMNLIVKPKKGMFKNTLFEVFDTNGNKLLKIVKGDSIFMSKDRLILDASGSPIATLRRKNFSWHDVWKVYRGKNDTNEEDAIFRVKRKDGLTLNVFMGSTDEKDEIKDKKKKKGEFDIVGFPPTFYMGDAIVADVNNNFSWGGDDVKKGFKVRVGAGTDYAFITCLVIIHREMAMTGQASGAVTEAVVGGGIEVAVGLAGGGDGGGGGGDGGGGGGS